MGPFRIIIWFHGIRSLALDNFFVATGWESRCSGEINMLFFFSMFFNVVCKCLQRGRFGEGKVDKYHFDAHYTILSTTSVLVTSICYTPNFSRISAESSDLRPELGKYPPILADSSQLDFVLRREILVG